jgi:tRNA modification GTPase
MPHSKTHEFIPNEHFENIGNTIAAVSTPYAIGGIGIVRLSGNRAIEICSKIFFPVSGKSIQNQKSWTMSLGKIKDKNNNIIDEAILSIMRSPYSYTGEDVCEINCHGGMLVCDNVLRLCMENGAVLAEAGEFTKRAFINGKLDLTQAEAVIDLISAKTSTAMQGAAAQLNKAMSRKINNIRDSLIKLNGDILVGVEYPEEDTKYAKEEVVLETLSNIYNKINNLYLSFEGGRAMKEGISCVICGKPNVGKSSLLNFFAGFERAIVTPVEGTTRDVIEEKVSVGKVILNLADTAGIRKTEDLIEKIGIEKTKEYLDAAELILFVADVSKPPSIEDYELFSLCEKSKFILIMNKIDLGFCDEWNKILDKTENKVFISAKSGKGTNELTEKINDMFFDKTSGSLGEIVTNPRQRERLYRAMESINIAIDGLNNGFTADLITGDIIDAADFLGEITGQTATEDSINNIFSRFCIGK